MECYNCGAPLSRAHYCEQCGVDVKIYKKIIKASNSYYNEGLERASVRNLTGAVESLKKSLQLNKMHIDARNLLGLVYFEMGETVAALSEWVISKNYKSRNNAASKYLKEIQSNSGRLETINQTIKKYNQALLYCRQNSKDLAIIQLKKVLSLNPKLVKGHQLLALLYMEEGRYDQAKKALRSAAKIDTNNTITLRYVKEVERKLREGNPKKKKNDDLISYQSGNETIIMPAHFKDNSAWTTIVNIVIGVVLGIAITAYLLVPNIRQQAKNDANTALKAANDTISTKEQEITALEKDVEKLTKKVEKAKDSTNETESKMASYEQLLSAYSAYANEDMNASGSAIEQVNEADLSSSAKVMYTDLKARVNEKYIVTAYDEGYKAYSRGDYTTAVDRLKSVVEMDETYEDGNAVYYLAQSYRKAGNMQDAVNYYQKMVENYPGTERARTSQACLDEAAAQGIYPNRLPETTETTETTE
ncbi:MAG: tetratricopeptide repeat protein [Lachnospiraceae bacterium]|nr:tetratricopeptide repeat protein [Lachnospiraceae bacterium]